MNVVTSEIAVFNRSTGALSYLAPAAMKPNDPALDWVALPAGFTDESFVWSAASRTMAESLSKVKALLVAQVKAKNAELVQSTYTTVFGKQKKYSRKQAEVVDFRALAPSLVTLNTALIQPLSGLLPQFTGLTTAAQKKKFRFAMAEAALRGVTIDVVIGEYEAAIEMTEAKVASWEAVEQAACSAIKAAASVTAARAAFAAINWSWSAP